MGYFASQLMHFHPWCNFDSGKGLRRCQMGAYWATWAHFTVTNEPALISLPTGAGKTDLIIALSFAFQAERVLVITPAEVLRDGIPNFLHIALAIGGVLESQVDRALVGLEARDHVTPDEWESFRSICSAYFGRYGELTKVLWDSYLSKLIREFPLN